MDNSLLELNGYARRGVNSNLSITNTALNHGIYVQSDLLVPDVVYVIFGAMLVLIFIMGLVQNTLTIYVFVKESYLRKVHNVFIVGLAISDVSMCLFGVWMVIVAVICKKWIFGDTGCVYYGFTTTLLGLTQISLLAIIAIDRYLVIAKPVSFKPVNMRIAITTVCCCYCYGLLWSILPVLGWSSYQLEGIRLRCAVNWRSKHPSDLSYAMTILVMAWLLPLGAIIYCCCGIGLFIHREANKPLRVSMRRRNGKGSRGLLRGRSREKRVAFTVMYMICAFLLSWTPYSIVTLTVMFGNPDEIPLSFTMVPALCAKSSIIWNPIIYVVRHRDYRKACLRHIPCWPWLHNYFRPNAMDCNSSNIESSTIAQYELAHLTSQRQSINGELTLFADETSVVAL